MLPNLIEIKVPNIGSFRDVPVIEVFVSPGDTVSKEDSLITLESEKATMEIPSPVGGVVKELLVKVGDKVSQGSSILLLEPTQKVTRQENTRPDRGQFEPTGDNPSGAYIYILRNRAFSQLKIGFTERSPKERARELASSTGVPGEFYVERDWFVPADRVRELEKDIHTQLKRLGHHHGKEFFSVDVTKAVDVIETILGRHNLLEIARANERDRQLRLEQYQQEKAKQAREREEARLQLERERELVSQLDRFRLSLEIRLAERHRLRFQILPHVSATAAAALVFIYGLYSNMPWLLMLVLLAGGYFVGYEALASGELNFVRQRYRSLIQERVHKARSLMEGSELTPREVLSTDECKQLLKIN